MDVPAAVPSPFADADRAGRQVSNLVVGAGAVAARVGAPIRALALRASRKGDGRSPRSGTRSTGGARRLTGACGCAPSIPAMVAASCSAAGRRPRLQWGRRLRRPARSRPSSRRCASVAGGTSTVARGRQPTPTPRPQDVAIACCCSSRPRCSSVARCAQRPGSRPSRSRAAALRCRS